MTTSRASAPAMGLDGRFGSLYDDLHSVVEDQLLLVVCARDGDILFLAVLRVMQQWYQSVREVILATTSLTGGGYCGTVTRPTLISKPAGSFAL